MKELLPISSHRETSRQNSANQTEQAMKILGHEYLSCEDGSSLGRLFDERACVDGFILENNTMTPVAVRCLDWHKGLYITLRLRRIRADGGPGAMTELPKLRYFHAAKSFRPAYCYFFYFDAGALREAVSISLDDLLKATDSPSTWYKKTRDIPDTNGAIAQAMYIPLAYFDEYPQQYPSYKRIVLR